jgi:hypothetical protein
MRRLWLWDVANCHGVTDDRDRAMKRAQECMRDGDLARARPDGVKVLRIYRDRRSRLAPQGPAIQDGRLVNDHLHPRRVKPQLIKGQGASRQRIVHETRHPRPGTKVMAINWITETPIASTIIATTNHTNSRSPSGA